MQRYLSPAKRYMSRVIPHTADIKAFLLKRRLVSLGIATVLLLVTMLGFVAVRGRMNSENNDVYTHEQHSQGNSITTTITNGPPDLTNGANIPSNSSGMKTNVMVNNQQISVPENGSVSKTITNENGGTTHVNVSHSSSNSGDSTSSSATTTTNITTQSSSQNVNLHSP